ncbi:MAG: zinc metalloprotease HtpX [Deltaproteobacteria bacterium]|nr:zinc metalloprotease HtpX [Deltaproteobacteria bacterium]MBW2121409.1 zinc metalloprotease HtpX [Deltaproteobacteria bacterium]
MNTLRTCFLMGILTLLFLWIGDLLGGRNGMIIALVLAGTMNFVTYWFSDRIVLRMYGAREVGPVEAPDLHSLVGELTQRVQLPMPRIYVIENESPNAFATGRNPENAALAVTTGLLRILSREELMGVIGHELSHIRHRDILIGTVAATMAGAISYLSVMARWGAMFGGFGGDDEDGGGSFLMIVLVSILAGVAAMLIQMAISRSREYLADRGGGELTGHPAYLARALKKLDSSTKTIPMKANPATAHMFIVNPLKAKGVATLFSTHPPIEERIRRLEAMERERFS